LGPNGAGKTTLLRCLLDINKPSQGKILVNGNDVKILRPKEKAKFVAYVPQNTTAVFSYQVIEVVIMGRTPYLQRMTTPNSRDREIAEKALAQLEITHLAHRHFDELSGGERQMVLIARALAQQAQILIMDEPTASLDYGNQVRILKLVRMLAGQGYTIIMSSHFPDHAFLSANQVLMMQKGVVLERGHPDQVVTTENLTRLYASAIQVVEVTPQTHSNKPMKVCVPVIEQEAEWVFQAAQEAAAFQVRQLGSATDREENKC
ncbi:MAG: transporter related, partial [Sporomusa sp.]|nr:transporter related [Sporomusa sp.]